MTNNSYWGLLGPGDVENTRSTLTLEVGAAVRQFNNLAVPGMGNIWFVRQLLLSLLGIYVADAVREKNPRARIGSIEVANAIEAFANYLSYQKNNWQAEPRLRGVNKMKLRRQEDFSFSQVRKKCFYVTQPLRMGKDLRAQLHGIVISEDVESADECFQILIKEINKSAPSFSPKKLLSK